MHGVPFHIRPCHDIRPCHVGGISIMQGLQPSRMKTAGQALLDEVLVAHSPTHFSFTLMLKLSLPSVILTFPETQSPVAWCSLHSLSPYSAATSTSQGRAAHARTRARAPRQMRAGAAACGAVKLPPLTKFQTPSHPQPPAQAVQCDGSTTYSTGSTWRAHAPHEHSSCSRVPPAVA